MEKDLGVLEDNKKSMSQHCAQEGQEGNVILGCIRKNIVIRSRLPLCSALVRPHLECNIHLWALQDKGDMELLVQVQWRLWTLLRDRSISVKRIG